MRRGPEGRLAIAIALMLTNGCGASPAEPPREAPPPPPATSTAAPPPSMPTASGSAPSASASVPAASAVAAAAAPSAAPRSGPDLPREIAYIFDDLEALSAASQADFARGVEAYRNKDLAAAEAGFFAAWRRDEDPRVLLVVAKVQEDQGKMKKACDNYEKGWNRGAMLMGSGFGRGDLPFGKCPRLGSNTANRP